MPDITICILNWNSLNSLKENLNRLQNTILDIEVIITDQNSKDGSIDFLKDIDDKYQIIQNTINNGNSISRNIMINKAKGKYILLLDGDITLINNSIEELKNFLDKNDQYDAIGYYYKNCSLTEETEKENEITDNFLECYGNYLVPTQYGLFRKEVFNKINFPEFYPFERAGWGGEDDIFTLMFYKYNLRAAMINNRIYKHDIHSSWKYLGTEDEVICQKKIRLCYALFFKYFLNTLEQEAWLRTRGKLIFELDLSFYVFKTGKNLGDISFKYLFDFFFPFIKFNEDFKNVLCFGGSIIHHPAMRIEFKDTSNVILFGCGISSENEIIFDNNKKYIIYPRGRITYKKLTEKQKKNIDIKKPIGDIGFLFSILPLINDNGKKKKTIGIIDAYKDVKNFGELQFAVAENSRTEKYNKITDIDQFIDLLNYAKVVNTSQIHPGIIALALGVPAIIKKKDLRVEDVFNFIDFKVSEECFWGKNPFIIREKMQRTVHEIFKELFIVLSQYKKRMYILEEDL